MTRLELRTHVTHPAVPFAKTLVLEIELPNDVLPPLGSFISRGQVTYLVRTLTWFVDEGIWVSAQHLALDATDSFTDEVDKLLAAGWSTRELAS